MPKIPLYEHTPQASGVNAVRVNPSSATAVGNAGRNVGNAVAGVGNQMFNIGMEFQKKKQDAIDFSSLSSANRQMEEAALLHEDEMRTTDHKDWQSGWSKRSAQVIKGISDNFEGSDAARQQFEESSKTWQMRTNQQVKSAVTGKQIEQSIVDVKKSYDFFLAKGDIVNAEAVIRAGMAVNLFSASVGEDMITQAPIIADTNAALSAIAENPIAAEEAIHEQNKDGYVNFKHLDDADRIKFKNASSIAASKVRSQNNTDLVKRNIDGNPATEAEIMEMVEKKLLTPEQGESYMKGQGIGVFAPEGTYSALMEEIRATNLTGLGDKERAEKIEKMTNKIALSRLNSTLASTALTTFTDLLNTKHPSNAPAAAYGRKMITDLSETLFGLMPDPDSPEFEAAEKPDKKQKIMARDKMEEYQSALAVFTSQTPAPNHAQVGKFVRDMTKDHMDNIALFIQERDAKREKTTREAAITKAANDKKSADLSGYVSMGLHPRGANID